MKTWLTIILAILLMIPAVGSVAAAEVAGPVGKTAVKHHRHTTAHHRRKHRRHVVRHSRRHRHVATLHHRRHIHHRHKIAKHRASHAARPLPPPVSEKKLNRDLAEVPSAGLSAAPPSTRRLRLRSTAALVIDQSSGQALYAKNPDLQTPIASITKLMTALVVLDAKLPMSQSITISKADVDHLKHTRSRLPVGTTLTRSELLHLALIASANRAAAALARTYPGGTAACVRAMNLKAAQLGMTRTHYVEATGLNSHNRSTAIDLAKLVNAASQYPLIRQITSTGKYHVKLPGYRLVRIRRHGRVHRVAREIKRRVAFVNTDLLTRNPRWKIGLSKTGFINEAGHCLVLQTRIADHKVIMVLLDSVGRLSRIGDANRIRHWLEAWIRTS